MRDLLSALPTAEKHAAFLMPLGDQLRVFAFHVAHHTPLPAYIFVGAFIEEVVSPIPAAIVMGTAGSLALHEGHGFFYLLFLAVIGNIGKTGGSLFYYMAGDFLEDILRKKTKPWFGIRHEDIESFGRRFTGSPVKDGAILFLLRAVPMFPTTPLSIACGVIRFDLRSYLIASYFGNFVKDLPYILGGYFGLVALRAALRDLESAKVAIDLAITLALFALLAFLYWKRRHGKRLALGLFRRIKKSKFF
jgi:membrane protein DedA with SNARE-associated domain